MCQDSSHIYSSSIKMNSCNQPIFIATYIKHILASYFIYRAKGLFQIIKPLIFRQTDDLKPRFKRPFAVWIFLPKDL